MATRLQANLPAVGGVAQGVAQQVVEYSLQLHLIERVRSEFVLRASHELRTPVTGMHMAFGLFRERAKFPAESREADLLDTVNEEMQRLMQLINDLLNFSRYQNGLQKLTLGPCDVTDLLEHARARFAEPANAQNIELLVEAQPDLPRLYADQVQRNTNSLRTRSKARCSVTSCNTITAPRMCPWVWLTGVRL